MRMMGTLRQVRQLERGDRLAYGGRVEVVASIHAGVLTRILLVDGTRVLLPAGEIVTVLP